MTKVSIIVGLPGSGKTTLGNKLKKQKDAFLIDDIKDKGEIEKAIKEKHQFIVITDPYLIFKKNRTNAKKHILSLGIKEIEWIFFENNKEKCLKNVKKRNDNRKVENFINLFSKDYTIPKNAKIIKIKIFN